MHAPQTGGAMKALPLIAALTATLPAGPAPAHMLTLEIHPADDPRQTVACALILDDGRMRLAETAGLVARPVPPMSWFPTDEEEAALLTALAAFLSGEIESIDPTGVRNPPAPYVAVHWSARMAEGLRTGYWHQPGLALPEALAPLAMTVLEGGPCGA